MNYTLESPINGLTLIKNERQRQVAMEGWTAEHDDAHAHGELAIAAACYAVYGTDAAVVESWGDWTDGFPWEEPFDKRDQHSDLRRLVIAGALIAAEIDRMLRSGAAIDAARSGGDTPAGTP